METADQQQYLAIRSTLHEAGKEVSTNSRLWTEARLDIAARGAILFAKAMQTEDSALREELMHHDNQMVFLGVAPTRTVEEPMLSLPIIDSQIWIQRVDFGSVALAANRRLTLFNEYALKQAAVEHHALFREFGLLGYNSISEALILNPHAWPMTPNVWGELGNRMNELAGVLSGFPPDAVREFGQSFHQGINIVRSIRQGRLIRGNGIEPINTEESRALVASSGIPVIPFHESDLQYLREATKLRETAMKAVGIN